MHVSVQLQWENETFIRNSLNVVTWETTQEMGIDI